jgi:hypothetical protein
MFVDEIYNRVAYSDPHLLRPLPRTLFLMGRAQLEKERLARLKRPCYPTPAIREWKCNNKGGAPKLDPRYATLTRWTRGGAHEGAC